jgi:aspartyl-tRNA(Asn)/glutamyl-tRNA(Gln) amidotransferase subunit C
MSVNHEDIKKISRLARIEISKNDFDNVASQVNKIIGWVDSLKEVDTSMVEPMTGVYDTPLRLEADKITDGGIAEDVLKNAPDAKYGYFTVPKVIE